MKHTSNKTRLCGCTFVFCLALAATSLFGSAVHATQIQDNDKIVMASSVRLGDDDMLSKRALGGMAVTVSSHQTINSTSSGNTLNVNGNLTNGNIFTGDNFGGSGFGSYVLNTGNNSTINSGVSLSILMLQ